MTTLTQGREARLGDLEQPNKSKTPFLLWLASFIVLMVIYGIRLPGVTAKTREQAPDELTMQEDPAIVDLGIMIGSYLFILIMAFVSIIYYVAASVLNARLYPSGFLTWKKRPIGYFFFLASAATIIPQGLAVLCGVIKPQDVPLFWLCPIAVTAAGLFLYRQCSAGVSFGKKVSLAAISFLFATLPLL